MYPVQARPTPGALAPPRTTKPGFVDGVRCFFRGFALLGRSPGALPLALVPAAMALVITIGFVGLVAFFVPDWIDAWIGTTGWWVPIVKWIATGTIAVLSVLLGLALSQPASGPALEGIVRRVERTLGLPVRPESSFAVEVARSTGSAAIGLTGAVTSFVVLLLIGLIPGAMIVTVPLKFVAAAFCIGWDVCDYPLSVGGMPLGDRLAFVFRNRGAVLGFSLGIALCALVPCGFLLVLPVGVAGATALVNELRAFEGRNDRALPPARFP